MRPEICFWFGFKHIKDAFSHKETRIKKKKQLSVNSDLKAQPCRLGLYLNRKIQLPGPTEKNTIQPTEER